MKKIFGFLLTLALFFSANAQTTVFRRIDLKTETIPASDTITGKVWTDSTDTYLRTLKYIGTTNIDSISKTSISKQGFYWMYIPSASKLAKVVSVKKTGVDTFSVQTYQSVPAIVNASVKIIKANLFSYSFQNDSTTTGTVNGVTVKGGTKVEFPFSWINGTGLTWQEPVIINATGAKFLVIEKH